MGSKPVFCEKGWQRNNLFIPFKVPGKKPNLTIACLVYSEQLGIKRQEEGSIVRMYLWYMLKRLKAILCNIKKIAFGDNLLRFSQWVMFYTFLYPKEKFFFCLFGGGGLKLFYPPSWPSCFGIRACVYLQYL